MSGFPVGVSCVRAFFRDFNGELAANMRWAFVDINMSSAYDLASADTYISRATLAQCTFEKRAMNWDSDPGTAGPYATIGDKVELLLRFGDGSTQARFVYAPAEDIFLADNETVDLTNPQVLDWFAVQQSYAKSINGQMPVALVKGLRR